MQEQHKAQQKMLLEMLEQLGRRPMNEMRALKESKKDGVEDLAKPPKPTLQKLTGTIM